VQAAFLCPKKQPAPRQSKKQIPIITTLDFTNLNTKFKLLNVFATTQK
jgi:hypothetical protein